MRPPILLSSHTISGVLPGDPRVQRHSFTDRVRAASLAGFDGLCLHMRDHAQLAALGATDADLRAILLAYDQQVPAVEFLSDWHRPGSEARANRAMAFAATEAFGAGMIHVGADAGAPLGLGAEDFVLPFLDLCQAASARGLRVAVEFVAWGIFERLGDLVDLVERADGRAGLLLDIWHLSRRGVSAAELDALPPEMVFGVQVSDAVREPRGTMMDDTLQRRFCGAGDLDVVGFLAGAARRGWQAPVSVEVIAPEVAAMEAEVCARRAYETTAILFPEVWRD